MAHPVHELVSLEVGVNRCDQYLILPQEKKPRYMYARTDDNLPAFYLFPDPSCIIQLRLGDGKRNRREGRV